MIIALPNDEFVEVEFLHRLWIKKVFLRKKYKLCFQSHAYDCFCIYTSTDLACLEKMKESIKQHYLNGTYSIQITQKGVEH